MSLHMSWIDSKYLHFEDEHDGFLSFFGFTNFIQLSHCKTTKHDRVSQAGQTSFLDRVSSSSMTLLNHKIFLMKKTFHT